MTKRMGKLNFQSTVVALCILIVCIGTQQMQSMKWDSGKIEFFRDSLGVLMALILFTHYKWSDFVKYKIPYLAWSIVGGVSLMVVTPIVIAKRYEFLTADTIVIALGIFLMGYCVIHTAINFGVEKYRPKLYKPLFVLWLVLLVWMIFSKSDYLWPECYFVLFLCYYLTPQTPKQRANVSKGMVNGVILGYLAIQGHAFLCRPYDRVRYYGNFCNPNHNCAFLCICLVAILAKLLYLAKENGTRLVKMLFLLLAGSCYSFICMTVCRSGYIATFVITIFFLIAYCKMLRKKVFVKMGAVLVLTFVVMLPVSYLAVRYLPTIHPHVLFYFQEQYSEERVHSWDERDSEKFVSFRELMTEVLGRFVLIFDAYDELQEDGSNAGKNAANACSGGADMYAEGQNEQARGQSALICPQGLLADLRVASAEGGVTDELLRYVDPKTGELDPDRIPALEEETNAILVRYTIYKWYFDHLSLRGMPYDEQGFQLTPTHWIQDTHNIYLDYGINFGYPAMILFAVFVWWGIVRLCRQGLKKADAEKCVALLFVLLPPVFGMFEFAWGAGTITSVVFYLCFKEIFVESHEESPVENEDSPLAAKGSRVNP